MLFSIITHIFIIIIIIISFHCWPFVLPHFGFLTLFQHFCKVFVNFINYKWSSCGACKFRLIGWICGCCFGPPSSELISQKKKHLTHFESWEKPPRKKNRKKSIALIIARNYIRQSSSMQIKSMAMTMTMTMSMSMYVCKYSRKQLYERLTNNYRIVNWILDSNENSIQHRNWI